jgi:hypothetical protein
MTDATIAYFTQGDEVYMLPSEWQIKDEEFEIKMLEADLPEKIEKEDTESHIKTRLLETRKSRLAQLRKSLDNVLKMNVADKKKAGIEVREFKVSKPTFLAYAKAEDDSKIWVLGEARVDDNQLAISLLDTHLHEGGKALSRDEIEGLDSQIILALFRRIKSICFPDPGKIPFLLASQGT